MDCVHVGDRDGTKGLYLVNLADEITHYEFVGAVAGISERFLVPLLEGLLLSFPLRILGFTPTTPANASTTGSPHCSLAGYGYPARSQLPNERWHDTVVYMAEMH